MTIPILFLFVLQSKTIVNSGIIRYDSLHVHHTPTTALTPPKQTSDTSSPSAPKTSPAMPIAASPSCSAYREGERPQSTTSRRHRGPLVVPIVILDSDTCFLGKVKRSGRLTSPFDVSERSRELSLVWWKRLIAQLFIQFACMSFPSDGASTRTCNYAAGGITWIVTKACCFNLYFANEQCLMAEVCMERFVSMLRCGRELMSALQ